MHNSLLFLLCAFVYGSTWFAITLQLGVVDPLWSVCYRYILSAALLALFCCYRKSFVRFSLNQHWRLFLQGSCLCGLAYWFTYLSELHITSALSALMSTTILYLNLAIGRLWLGNPVRFPVFMGGCVGSVGILLIFLPDLHFSASDNMLQGMLLAFIGCIFFSIGSVACEKNEREGLALLPVATLNMFYGGVLVSVIALVKGCTPVVVFSFEYIASLLYLIFFGSIAALVSYMALIRRIGADRTAYVDIVYPVIALFISTIFEGYQWTLLSITGVFFVITGNLVALGGVSKLLVYVKRKGSNL